MDQSIKFWDRSAERYAARPVADEESYREKLALTQQHFHPHKHVLEFGCGTGSTALVHAPHVARYTAIDASPNMINIARRKLASQPHDNLHFNVSTLEDIASEQSVYDAVLGLNILHLLENYDTAINQVFHLLKPGGVFVSNTACLGNTMNYFRYIAPIGRFLRVIPRVQVFTRQALEDSMTTAGFAIEHRWVPPRSPLVYFLIARKPA